MTGLCIFYLFIELAARINNLPVAPNRQWEWERKQEGITE